MPFKTSNVPSVTTTFPFRPTKFPFPDSNFPFRRGKLPFGTPKFPFQASTFPFGTGTFPFPREMNRTSEQQFAVAKKNDGLRNGKLLLQPAKNCPSEGNHCPSEGKHCRSKRECASSEGDHCRSNRENWGSERQFGGSPPHERRLKGGCGAISPSQTKSNRHPAACAQGHRLPGSKNKPSLQPNALFRRVAV